MPKLSDPHALRPGRGPYTLTESLYGVSPQFYPSFGNARCQKRSPKSPSIYLPRYAELFVQFPFTICPPREMAQTVSATVQTMRMTGMLSREDLCFPPIGSSKPCLLRTPYEALASLYIGRCFQLALTQHSQYLASCAFGLACLLLNLLDPIFMHVLGSRIFHRAFQFQVDRALLLVLDHGS